MRENWTFRLLLSSFAFLLLLGATPAPIVHAPPITTPIGTIGGSANQSDPHVDGDIISFTDSAPPTPSNTSVRYVDLSTGLIGTIPKNPQTLSDLSSDVSDGRIAFVRAAPRVFRTMLFHVANANLSEINPEITPDRVAVSIGGETAAYVDRTASTSLFEIVVVDLVTGLATPLTSDTRRDMNPSVSPNGDVVVWVSCDDTGANCNYMEAVEGPSGWSVEIRASAGIGSGRTATDGALVVYDAAVIPADRDILWQPVGGGEEFVLAMAGSQGFPNISDGVIVFESFLSGQRDIFAYDTTTSFLYRVTDTASHELTPDISVRNDIATITFALWTNEDDFEGVPEHDIQYRRFELIRPPDFRDLIQELRESILASGTTLVNALDAHLQSAQRAQERGNQRAACGSLHSFTNLVKAQRGKQIRARDADAWLGAAQRLRDRIGC